MSRKRGVVEVVGQMRRCTLCRRLIHQSRFYRTTSGTKGRTARCKDCLRDLSKAARRRAGVGAP